MLPVSEIKVVSELSFRLIKDESVIKDYCRLLSENTIFPNITVFVTNYGQNTEYLLVDGFYRLQAHIQAKRDFIACNLFFGSFRDAQLFAVGVNASHGNIRTNDDKKTAVCLLLSDKEWCSWSNQYISNKCNVSEDFVKTMRKTLDKSTFHLKSITNEFDQLFLDFIR